MRALVVAAWAGLLAACASPPVPAWAPESPIASESAPAPTAAAPSASAAAPAAPRGEPEFDRARWENVFRPAGALDRKQRIPWRADARGYVARVGSGPTSLTWRVEPRAGFPLRLLSIEEEGARVVPCTNSYRAPIAPPGKPRKVALDDGRLVLEYDGGLVVRFEALGGAVLVELDGPHGYGNEPFELSLGGLLRGPGVTDLSAHMIYGCDDATTACLRLQRGGARFLSVRVDPTCSNASQLMPRLPGASGHDGEFLHSQRLHYQADTRGRVRPLYERVWIAWSDELLDVLPAMARPAPPSRELATRGYLGMHLLGFAEVERALREMSALGVRDIAVWMHKFQRDGYQRGYPNAVFPPNAEWGGLDGLRAARAAAREAGYLFSLYHNWMFNGERLPGASVLDSDGNPRGPGDGGQFLKPRVALELVDGVEGEFHAALQPEGSFLDTLTTGLPPVDLDAREPGAGLFLPALQKLAELVERVRAIHGGPLGGEGSVGFGNLLWSGQVDALNGYAGILTDPPLRETLGRFAEFAPDFNLWRLRPLSVRVGVGEPPRFLDPFGPPRLAYEPEERDQMLTAIALLGNTSDYFYVPGCNSHEAARDWWATDAAARRMLDTARQPLCVEYVDPRNGRRGTLSQHLASGGGLHIGELRARVDYSGGLAVWANLTSVPWALDAREPGLGGRTGIVLAPWGRYVVDDGFECGLLQQDGRRVEFARGAGFAFVDGRGEWVERFGVASDGAVALRKLDDGSLDVYPLREFRVQVAQDNSDVRVVTHRVRLGAEWLRELGARARIAYVGLPAGAEIGAFDLAVDPDGLELDIDALARAGALALRIRAAR